VNFNEPPLLNYDLA